MGDVRAFEAFAQRPALDRVRQDDRRPPAIVAGTPVSRVDLAVAVTAASQAPDVLVREILDHGEQARIGAEKIATRVVARRSAVLLH